MLLCLWGRLPAVCCLCVGVTWPPVLVVDVRLVLCTVVGGGGQGGPPVAQTPSSAVCTGHCSWYL